MGPRFEHAALVGKYQADGIGPLIGEIAQFLQQMGLRVSLEAQTHRASGLGGFDALDADGIGAHCDVAVVVGGDGTMLGIARQLARFDVPLVGINHGRLGFITDVPLAGWREGLGAIVQGEVDEDVRTLLDGEVWRDGVQVGGGAALNDVVVSRGSTSSMIEVRIDIGDEFVANIRADGLIVCTPTGSTAYALSAGGPIVHPRIAGWTLLPVASHTLSNRPIVLPDADAVRVTLLGGREASVNFDSQGLASLVHGDQIRVQRSPHRTRFLHPRGFSHYATLRRKLRWYEG